MECVECGSSFAARAAAEVCCGPHCWKRRRDRLRRDPERERRRSRERYVRKRQIRCHDCGVDLPLGRQGVRYCPACKAARVPVAANCLRCGSLFTPRPSTSAVGFTTYCARACYASGFTGFAGKGHKGRVARYGGQYEPVDRLTVFDRDGWLCQLCDLPVDRDLKWPDPGSVSLDHVVPLSRGGDHTYANVWTAHLSCNIAKHNVRQEQR